LTGSPLVSVILTSYNYARYVGEAISSVLGQTYANCELIVVDDGSSDGSPEIIQAAVADARIPVKTVFQENRGQAAAMNAGFQRATGELVAFLDSDDLWTPNKIAEMVAFIQGQPEGGVYQHQVDDGSGKLVVEPLVSGDYYAKWLGVRTLNTAIRHDLFLVFAPTSGLMFRKCVLDEVFPLPEQMIACPDTFMAFIASRSGPLYSNPRLLGSWRAHDKNAGKQSRFSFKGYGIRVVLPAINDRFKELGDPIRLVYSPVAVLWEPVRLVMEALARRKDRKTAD
jgi:glycosyltransferase involved in cell wall biosynthesis